jgi:hypothetical protein
MLMQEYRSKEIYGDLYENGSKPLAVVIGGSRAGIPSLGKNLFDYLSANYNLLLLAYFGVGDLPKTLERVPIEYFVNAVRLVQTKLKLDERQVVMIGNSKGAEIALILTKYLQSAITIACVPGCYVFQGLPVNFFSLMFPKSSWSFNHKDLPYIKFSVGKDISADIKNKIYTSCYERSIKKHFNKNALIDIGAYKGGILLLSAEHDKFWPSKKMSHILVENNRHQVDISHTVLDLEGHYFLQYEASSTEMIRYLMAHAPSLA